MTRVQLEGRPDEVWTLLEAITEDAIWAAVDSRYRETRRTVLARQDVGAQPGYIAGVYITSVRRVLAS